MPRLTPLPWKTIECVLSLLGYSFVRQKGSHRIYYGGNLERPIVLPAYPEVGVPIIKNILDTANISRDKFLSLLKNCK
ncbi:MAG: type II toxin-antitoxin system HicA family toxin [Desulfovibrio sp.]|nr:type II toxin-antitoxin system HicA family toxin [Desulfovibrio sp.]